MCCADEVVCAFWTVNVMTVILKLRRKFHILGNVFELFFSAQGSVKGDGDIIVYTFCPCEWDEHEITSCSLSEQTTDDADDTVGHKSFISATVQTGFCDWSAKYFAQPVMKVILSGHAFWIVALQLWKGWGAGVLTVGCWLNLSAFLFSSVWGGKGMWWAAWPVPIRGS